MNSIHRKLSSRNERVIKTFSDQEKLRRFVTTDLLSLLATEIIKIEGIFQRKESWSIRNVEGTVERAELQ